LACGYGLLQRVLAMSTYLEKRLKAEDLMTDKIIPYLEKHRAIL
jgi:hypothetical protein